MKIRTLAVIPARYGAQRFPGKPLAMIAGKPLVQRVYEQAAKAKRLDKVIVATEDTRILEAVEAFGGDAMLTSPDCATGTDRVAEVARSYECELVVNIQGDEPLMRPEMIDQLVQGMMADGSCVMGTLARTINVVEQLTNPNVVKVVIGANGNALYFSRSPVPYVRDAGVVAAVPAAMGKNMPPGTAATTKTTDNGGLYNAAGASMDLAAALRLATFYKHLGIYAYRRDFLLKFVGLPQSALEKTEKLEQLRALENGFAIKVFVTPYDSIGVDRPEDIELVEEILANAR
ncbi:MAG TPA: 3-deoxy-manno-octulosonate cytidylyltransferase [Verrucomicrobiae bacterium]|nr:3-deoxy-manno-octulosonate cytidylyltransferase [Verrucomicrobiae bacterium]